VLHTTQPDTAIANVLSIILTLLTVLCYICDVLTLFWQLNLIAINLKNIRERKLIRIVSIYGKPSIREFFPDSYFFGYEIPQKLLRIRKFQI
jgi:hypothetical protein